MIASPRTVKRSGTRAFSDTTARIERVLATLLAKNNPYARQLLAQLEGVDDPFTRRDLISSAWSQASTFANALDLAAQGEEGLTVALTTLDKVRPAKEVLSDHAGS